MVIIGEVLMVAVKCNPVRLLSPPRLIAFTRGQCLNDDSPMNRSGVTTTGHQGRLWMESRKFKEISKDVCISKRRINIRLSRSRVGRGSFVGGHGRFVGGLGPFHSVILNSPNFTLPEISLYGRTTIPTFQRARPRIEKTVN